MVTFLSLSLETWTLLVIFLTLFFLYGTWTHGLFKKIGVPGPRPLPFIGTYYGYRNGIIDFDIECFKKYGKIWGIYDGRQPVLAVTDPTIIKTVLVKEFYTYFTNRRQIASSKILDSGLTAAKDEQWKRIRTVLSPTFTSGKLKEMFSIIEHYGEILVKNVQKKAKEDGLLDMKELFGAYSMDAVVSTSFGVNVDSMNNPNDPFVTNSKRLFSFRMLSPKLILPVLFPFLNPVFRLLGIEIFAKDVLIFFSKAVNSIKEKRQKGKHENRVDFMQLMVDSQKDTIPELKGLTDEEITAQSLVFILAGYETTSSALSFTAYNLATHPEIQQRLQKEIDTRLPKKAAPTYDALMQMEYLDMVINETLRKYPFAGRLERICKKTIEINGLTIPEGVSVMIPLSVLHQDPEYWPEPDEFNPERFSKDNKDTQDPYTFLPFGSGPRNCIGMRFALLNIKSVLVALLQNFNLQTCKETPIPMVLDTKGVPKSKSPIILKLVPRTDALLEG